MDAGSATFMQTNSQIAGGEFPGNSKSPSPKIFVGVNLWTSFRLLWCTTTCSRSSSLAAASLAACRQSYSINQSINQSVLFQATRPIHEKQRKEKTHKHTVVKQTDRQTDIQTYIRIMYSNMAGAACAVPLQEHCYMRTICYWTHG